MKRIWFYSVLALSLLFNFTAGAQDSCRMRVSLLTCSPGSELYSIFGHSALRIVDSAVGTDIVYNYGTFDFGDPNFYSKFIRGKLLYFLSQTSFQNFSYEYQVDNRSIAEQLLNMNCSQKQALREFVYHNLQGENVYYKYDFLYDNCTTRLRDMIEKFREPTFKDGKIEIADGMSFRDGIHYYLNKGEMHWSKFGIDLLLGSRIDRKMTNREAMFLPEFLEQSLDKTGVQQDSLVKEKSYPVVKAAVDEQGGLSLTPMGVFGFIALLIISISFSKTDTVFVFLKWFDIVFFLTIGLLGCLFLFMWLGTDHKQTANNYNILWAWPTHIIAAFLLINKKANVRRYFFIYMMVLGLTLLAWPFLPQALNPGIIPILILGIFRCWKNYHEYSIDQKIAS